MEASDERQALTRIAAREDLLCKLGGRLVFKSVLLQWRITDGQTGEEASFRFSVTMRSDPLSTEVEELLRSAKGL